MKHPPIDQPRVSDAFITQGVWARHNDILQHPRAPRLKHLNEPGHECIRRCHNRSIPSHFIPPHILGYVPPGYRPTYVQPLRMVSRLVHHSVNDNDIYLDQPFLYPNGLLLAKEYDLHITRRDRRITRRAAYRPDR